MSLLIAAFAIMPKASRLRLSMNWKLPFALTVFLLAFVLYLQFFDILGLSYSKIMPNELRDLFTISGGLNNAQRFSFIVVLFWMGGIWIFISRKKIAMRRLPQFQKLISELVRREKFQEACALLLEQQELFVKVTEKSFISHALHEKFSRFNTLEYLIANIDSPKTKSNLLARKTYPLAAKFFPSGEKERNAISYMLGDIAHSSGMIERLATLDVRLGLSLLQLDTYGSRDYQEKFLVALFIADKGGFYRELRDGNQNSRTKRYDFERYPILASLFNDAQFAEERSVWKPIGDHIIEKLQGHNGSKYGEFLNSPCVNEEKIVTNDVTYYGILYFNHMVCNAAHANIPYHMWLYYFSTFAELLLENYDTSDSKVDTTAEHPINASYLIWQIISTLTSWMELRNEVSTPSNHSQVEKADSSHENSNIPKSAAICLADCLEKIVLSGEVSDGFKVYCTEIVMRSLSQCRDDLFRQAFVSCLLREKGYGDKSKYFTELKRLLRKVDHVITFEIKDLTQALDQKTP